MTAITVTSVTARAGGGFFRPASALVDVSLSWDRGVLAIVGAAADGTTALLEVLAGSVRPKRGAVAFAAGAGGERPRIVHVRKEPSLPDGLRVGEILALGSALRGGEGAAGDPREVLEVLGVAHLAARRSSSLTLAEARTVQLALALAARVDVLLLEEPLVGLEPPAAGRVVVALRAMSGATSIVLTTASVRDARTLADRVLLLSQGRLVELPPSELHVGGGHAAVVAVLAGEPDASDAFVRALERMPAIEEVAAVRYSGGGARHASISVTVRGADARALATAVMRAAAATSAPIEAISTEAPSLAALRASLFARAAPAAPPPSPPSPPSEEP